MEDREIEIGRISVGDIFHASAPNGASLICLTEMITDTVIRAKTVTSQFLFEFDRATGIAEWEYEGRPAVECIIDSVAALPSRVHELMLELNCKYSTGDDPRLTDEQKHALLFVWRFYPGHPLPMPRETTSIGRTAAAEGPEDHELTLEEFQQRLLVTFQIPAPRP